MSILVQSAIAHLGEAEHPLDDADRMFDPGPHFRFGAIFRSLDLIDDAAVAIAAIGEVLGLWCPLADHRALTTISLIAPHAGLPAMQKIGQHRAVGGIGWRGDHRMDQLAAAAASGTMTPAGNLRCARPVRPRHDPYRSHLVDPRQALGTIVYRSNSASQTSGSHVGRQGTSECCRNQSERGVNCSCGVPATDRVGAGKSLTGPISADSF